VWTSFERTINWSLSFKVFLFFLIFFFKFKFFWQKFGEFFQQIWKISRIYTRKFENSKKLPTSTYILATCWSNLFSKYGDFRNLATLAKNLNSIEVHPQLSSSTKVDDGAIVGRCWTPGSHYWPSNSTTTLALLPSALLPRSPHEGRKEGRKEGELQCMNG
jgi:hypothetical protein